MRKWIMYHSKSPEERAELKERLRTNYLKNREERLAYGAAYAKANPAAVRLRVAARKAGAPGCAVTEKEWIKIQLDQEMKCYYCKELDSSMQVEHKIPLSRGGAHKASNIVAACEPCNSRKGTMTDVEFLVLLGKTTKPKAKEKTA